MIEEQAIVTQVGLGHVWIKPVEGSACAGCMQQASCGTATLSKLLPKREFELECDRDLQPGDRVVVAIDDSHLLATSLLMYLLPLLVMLTAVGLVDALLPAAEAFLPEIALAALLLAFWLLHTFQGVLLLRFCFRPKIISSC